jgi:predicted transcriptional regulator
MISATEILSLVDRRAQLLTCLQEGTATKRELETALDISRSTVDRAINELETAQLIDRPDRAYSLTLRGRIAYREFHRTVDRYDSLIDATSLLDHLPETATIPGVIFEDATVIRPSPPTPNTPRTQFADKVRQSEVVVGTGNVVSQHLIEVFHEQLTAHDLQLSLFLDKQVVEHLRHAYANILRTVLEIDHCTLWSAKQTPPFSLAIIDCSELWLGVYNEHGQLQGFLQTESSAAVEWAEQRLQQLTGQATSICRQDAIAKAPEKQ